jgi:NADH dehydrogenase [ubiquinone] 1 alpha subcomplex assembly factor 7
MNALEREIRALIESEGPIPVSRYMAIALGHPQYGYYLTRDPFGAGGDFITAPEVSQMFGELIGLWCAEVWRGMSGPARVHLVELGPGRGTLMSDLLRAARVVPDFHGALEVHLVDTSPVLEARQRAALEHAGVPIEWHRNVERLPAGPLIIIANEFLDALPVDQIVKTERGWHERKIGMHAGRLDFVLDPTPLDIEEHLPERLRGAQPGVLLESRDLAPMREVARRITEHGGAALIIDYGHTQSGFGDTLQGVRAHKTVDPLENPGQADLTSHVDFEALATAAMRWGLHAIGPVTQGNFLRAIGIALRAENLKRGRDPATVADVDAALARLTAPSPGMGELFKVLALVHPSLPSPPGFDP